MRKILNKKVILKETHYIRNCFLFGIFLVAGIFVVITCLISSVGQKITLEAVIGMTIFCLAFGTIFIWFIGLRNIRNILRDIKPIKNEDFTIYEDVLVEKTIIYKRDNSYPELIFDRYTFKTGNSIAVNHKQYRDFHIKEEFYIIVTGDKYSAMVFSKEKYDLDSELYSKIRSL